jgi:hypothetical protein
MILTSYLYVCVRYKKNNGVSSKLAAASIVTLWIQVLEAVDCCRIRPTHHVTRYNTPIHNILLSAPQLSISQNQKALGTLPGDSNVMPKHVGATIHN